MAMNAQVKTGQYTLGPGSASEFCSLLAAARFHKFPGSWSGSAFRHHPCGVIEGTIKLTNEWNVNDYCSIAITDGDGWRNDYCTNSCAYGNPNPRPQNGVEIVVWREGRWVSKELREALEPRVNDLLQRMRAHVEDSIERQKTEQKQAVALASAEQAARTKAAIARAQGGQS